MSRWQNRKTSIYGRLGRLLLLAAAVGILAFLMLYAAGMSLIDRFAWDGNYLAREGQNRADSLQAYIEKNNVSTGDSDKLTVWVKKQAVVAIQIYKDGYLVYDSNYPDEIFDPDEYVLSEETEQYYTLNFSDGSAEVFLYGFYAYQFYNYVLIGDIVVAFAIFFCVVMGGIRRTIHYIRKLSEEIKILEGGDLDYEITVKGRDELAELAEGLNSMRKSFREQNRREEETVKANQRMVTEMSHDLRTPLTAIMLYTEILQNRKYGSEEQMQEYLRKIDEKARRMKLLSDHLFSYSLVHGEKEKQQTEKVLLRAALYDMLSEAASYLEQQGFRLEMEAVWEERYIRIDPDYLGRIFDNLTSNIVKYADRESPVAIRSVYVGSMAGVSFENRKAQQTGREESTGIGLRNVAGMMHKMKGVCKISQTKDSFRIVLLFSGCEKTAELPASGGKKSRSKKRQFE